jgi:hypothetical protein
MLENAETHSADTFLKNFTAAPRFNRGGRALFQLKISVDSREIPGI